MLQLDSLILTTSDQELSGMFRHHKEETRRQQKRLRERRVALGRRMGLSAASKDLAAIAFAQIKGVGEDSAYGGAGAWWTRARRQLVAYDQDKIVKVRVNVGGFDDHAARAAAVRLAKRAVRRLRT